MIRISSVARKRRIFDIIKNQREMDGGKNPHAKTERKRGNFRMNLDPFVIRQHFLGKNRPEPKKAKKIRFSSRAPFPVQNFLREEAGVSRARVILVEALFISRAIALR